MANVEHSLLTGAALHEPKGVASQPANRVYVSNGLGSGVWTSLSTFNAFGSQLLHVRDSRSSGTAAQSLTNGVFTKRDLQTTATNEISGASLSSSVISLPAGTYFIEAYASTYGTLTPTEPDNATGHSKLKFRNTSDGTDAVIGKSNTTTTGVVVTGGEVSQITFNQSLQNSLAGRFTIAATKSFELQNWVSGWNSSTGGTPVTSGVNEIYADVYIWKVA